MMATILFYSPFNQRSRDTESLMIAFHQQGHKVISLSQAEGMLIHDVLKAEGIETHSHVVNSKGWSSHWNHLRYLVRFCKMHNVDIVYSHLESANFIGALAQPFIKATVYLCRHHADQYKMLGLDQDLSYRLTYRLARHIIVPSESTKRYMVKEEKITRRKIIQINLAFDFTLYPPVRASKIEEIRRLYSAKCVLVTVGSFLPLKRPELSILTLKALRDRGLDAKLVLLGKGELEPILKDLVHNHNLSDCVFFAGHVTNVMEYIAAGDFLLHPSVSEASCVAVKECGLVERPPIVCRGVGDFDDYIVHESNGFLVGQDNFVQDATAIVERYMADETKRHQIGRDLKIRVIELFDIRNVAKYYEPLNNRLS